MSNFRLLSASQLTTYSTCTQQWAYRYIEKAPEESRAGALVLGSAVDVAIKTLVHQVRAGEATIATVKPKDLLHEAWGAETSVKPDVPIDWGEKGEPASLRTAEALVEAFAKLPDLEARIARIASVDLRFELPILDPRTGQPVPGLGVQGILDFVERDAAGNYCGASTGPEALRSRGRRGSGTERGARGRSHFGSWISSRRTRTSRGPNWHGRFSSPRTWSWTTLESWQGS